MLKSLLAAAAAACLMAACTQGPNEEKGEAADTQYEQGTTGQTDMGQGPNEETGEALDAGQTSTATTTDTSTATTN